MKRPLARVERVAWLRLARTPGVGPLTFHRLLALHRTPGAALEAVCALGVRYTPPPEDDILSELDALDQIDGRLIASCEPDYPPLLAQLDAPPPALSVRGDARLFARPLVAIVGAREASAAGRKLAADFAHGLGRLGYAVVSGMARGIDAHVHEASLETGAVAVLAGGLDRPYPPQNLGLYERLCERGVVVSEAPLGFQARARDFPRRNHIISGVALGVVVIEAAERSGSLITARAAAEQGRDVMAVPGSPLDPRARGSNSLLKQGAILVESAQDVADALNATPVARAAGQRLPLVEAEPPPPGLAGRIAQLLSPTPIHINDLVRIAQAPFGVVAAAIMDLELDGRAASLPGGYVASSGAAFAAGG